MKNTRKVLLFLIGFIALSFLEQVSAQDKPKDATAPYLFPARATEKYGFIDKSGKMIIEPQFSDARPFAEGLAPVRKYGGYGGNDGWGYVDSSGKLVIKMEFETVTPFSEGMALVSGARGWQYIDKTGKTVIEKVDPYHGWPDSYFSEGLALITNGEHCGYLGKDGNIIIQGNFLTGTPFQDGLAAVDDAQLGLVFVDKTGKPVIKGIGQTRFNKVLAGFSEGIAAVEPRDSGGNAFIDKKGQTIGKRFGFGSARPFSEGLAFVAGVGFADKTGRIVIKGRWNNAKDFKEGLAAVDLEGDHGWGFIDKTGKVIIQPQFEEADSFYGGLARVSAWLPGKLKAAEGSRGVNAFSLCWIYIDKEGKIIWQPTARAD